MQNNVNQSKPKRIYDKQTRQWFEVSPEEYTEFDRWHTCIRKKQQKLGFCNCPRSKWWLCDGMCEDCEFRCTPGNIVSLDAPIETGDGDEMSLHIIVSDPDSLLESAICDKAELDDLFKKLGELMPEAVEIGRLRQKGLSDEAIAKAISIKRTAFLSRLKKAKERLAEDYPDRFYTDLKDPETEARVEVVLDAHGLFYQKSEVWIDSEKLYEVLYQFEIGGNENAQEQE